MHFKASIYFPCFSRSSSRRGLRVLHHPWSPSLGGLPLPPPDLAWQAPSAPRVLAEPLNGGRWLQDHSSGGEEKALSSWTTTKLKTDCTARGPESLTHSNPPCPSGETEAQREEDLVQGHTTSRCLSSQPLEQRVLWGNSRTGWSYKPDMWQLITALLFNRSVVSDFL